VSAPADPRPPRRAVVVDDSPLQCAAWRRLLERRYGERVAVETYTDPREAVAALRPDIHIMLLDWEMPVLDGHAVLEEARARGVNLKRVVITSGHTADELHEQFDRSGCLAVIEKTEPEQQAAFMMILDSIMRR
jgi:CheY-like chemotaxis protein